MLLHDPIGQVRDAWGIDDADATSGDHRTLRAGAFVEHPRPSRDVERAIATVVMSSLLSGGFSTGGNESAAAFDQGWWWEPSVRG